jgi:hypothetical protein
MGKSKLRRPTEFWNSLVSRNKPMSTQAREIAPDQFRVFAAERKWRLEVVEALLKPPVLAVPFFIGIDKHDPGGRQLVVIKEEAPVRPVRSAV